MTKTVVGVALAILAWASSGAAEDTFDLLVRHGLIVDGSGADGFEADVGIRDGRIVRVGDLSGATAKRTIDASGLVVAPGFIDIHNHSDFTPGRWRADRKTAGLGHPRPRLRPITAKPGSVGVEPALEPLRLEPALLRSVRLRGDPRSRI